MVNLILFICNKCSSEFNFSIFFKFINEKKNKKINGYNFIYFLFKSKGLPPFNFIIFNWLNKYRLQFSKFSDVILVQKIRLVEQIIK